MSASANRRHRAYLLERLVCTEAGGEWQSGPMSALGQKRTFAVHKSMSALASKATLIRKAPRIAALHPNSATALAACIGATGHRA